MACRCGTPARQTCTGWGAITLTILPTRSTTGNRWTVRRQRLLTPTGATGTKFSALPEKAQKTIQAQAPNADIANISRSDKDGRVIYTVEFREPGKNPTIQVAEDGTLVQTLQK